MPPVQNIATFFVFGRAEVLGNGTGNAESPGFGSAHA